MEHWQPQIEAAGQGIGGLHAGRRVSLAGWSIGLALSLGLWAVLYYLFF